MVLAGDIGGTKTLLGLFDPEGDRPKPLVVREYATLDFDSLGELMQVFLEDTGAGASVTAVAVGVAGPVTGLVARLTKVPWVVDASVLGEQLGDCPVHLLNDLEAMAYAVPVLEPDEIAVLQEGVAVAGGNAAIIAAGTGLGESFLHNVDGQFVPSASEGGHADFPARTPRELALVEHLTAIYGRVDCDRVISGPGLVNLFGFTHGVAGPPTSGACRVVGPGVEESELPAAISACAMARRCEQCVEALEMFIEAYGAEAGNLALRSMATAGVYLGGGIAPKLLPALESGAFLEAFCRKTPLTDLLRTIPVSVILNPAAGLLGAAVRASAAFGRAAD
jgi:glucokinase